MTKSWKKTGTGQYSFWIDDTEAGVMHIAHNTNEHKAVAVIDGNEYTIKRTGFWKSTIEITGADGQTIAKAYYEKWYANSLILEYKNNTYKMVIRNNPLAEWAILDNGRNILAYGLDTENGRTALRITSSANDTDILLDFLLWYVFVPIATENSGDHFVFTMMLANQ